MWRNCSWKRTARFKYIEDIWWNKVSNMCGFDYKRRLCDLHTWGAEISVCGHLERPISGKTIETHIEPCLSDNVAKKAVYGPFMSK